MKCKPVHLLPLLLLACLSCQKESDPRYDQFEQTAARVEHTDLLAQKAVLLIPNGGCDTFITSAEGFALRNIDTAENFRVIFTSTQSQ